MYNESAIQNRDPRRPMGVRLNGAERHALRMLAARRRLSGSEVLRRLIEREARRVGFLVAEEWLI